MPQDKARLTMRREVVRTIFSGPYSALNGSQFLLFVALSYFAAPNFQKSLIAAAVGVGMLLNPLLLSIIRLLRLSLPRSIALLLLGAAGLLSPAALVDDFRVYLPCVFLAVGLLAGLPTLITGMWRENVPSEIRGRHFSRVCFIGAISGLCCGGIIALFLSQPEDTEYYRYVLGAVVLCLLPAAWAVWDVPGEPVKSAGRIPYSSLRLLGQDGLFAYICFAWFFLGLGNLSTIPLRVEYIASGEHGRKYAVWLVLLLMQIIPQTMRLLSTLLWGRIFDVVNFIYVRMAINTLFFLSIVFFFQNSLAMQVLGSVFFGIASGGGEVVWNLWVTKIAPLEKTAEYMSVHVFLAGTRNVFGPLGAYYLLDSMALPAVSMIGAGCIMLSTVLFVPLLWHPRFIRAQGR